MPDIAELKKWCDEARSLLSMSLLSSEKGEMGSRNKRVAKLLGQMKDIPELKGEYDKYFERYEQLATAARDAADPEKGGKLNRKERKAIVRHSSEGLEVLGNEIDQSLQSHTTSVEQKQNARDSYLKELAEVDKLYQAVEKLGGGSDWTKLQSDYTAAKKLAANEDYSTALTSLNELRGRLLYTRGALLSGSQGEMVEREGLEQPVSDEEAKLRQAWAERFLEVRAVVHEFAETGTEHYPMLSKLLARNEKLAKQDPAAATKDLDEVAKIAARAKQVYFEELEKATAGVRDRCQKAEKDCQGLAALKGVPPELLAQLRGQMDAAWTLQASRNIEAQQGAGPVLDALEQALQEVKTRVADFQKVTATLKQAETVINGREFKTITPTAQDELVKALPGVQDEVKPLLPGKALETAQAFLTRAQKAADEAHKIVVIRERLAENIEKAKAALQKVDRALEAMTSQQETQFTKYEGQLVKELATVERLSKEENLATVTSAHQLLLKIIEKAESYGHGEYPKELLADQQKALADKDALKRKAQQWKVTYERFLEEFKVVEQAVKKAKGDTGDLKSIERLAKTANDTATKSNDFEAPGRQLQVAREQMVLLLKFPQGAKATCKAEVGKVSARWNTAVAQLQKDLQGLVKDVAERCRSENVDEAAIKIIEGRLPKVGAFFKPRVFDEHLKLVSSDDEGVTAKDRKASREAALMLVRQYQDYLNKNPLVRHVVLNPFKGGLLTEIYNTLHDLDLNIQRCI